MNLISKASFAALKGVSRPAITQAVTKGHLVEVEGKIDLDSASAIAYQPRRHNAGSKAKKPTASAPADPPASSTIADEDSDLEFTEAEIPLELLGPAKTRAEIRHRNRLADLASLRLETLKGTLIERSIVVEKVQGIQKAIADHLHRLPAKLGPKVYALARTSDATELAVMRAIEVDMGEAIRRAVDEITRNSLES